MSDNPITEKVSASGWVERFAIHVSIRERNALSIRGEHKLENNEISCRVIVASKNKEEVIETFNFNDTFDVAMSTIAKYCKKNYYLVNRAITALSSDFDGEVGAYVLSDTNGTEVAVVYNSYEAEVMVNVYNFILAYIRHFSEGDSYAKRDYLPIPRVDNECYLDYRFASVEVLRPDGNYILDAELRYNIHFREFHVVHYGYNGRYYADEAKYVSILHSHKRAYRKFASHVKNLILNDAFFVTPPMVYVDKNHETGRYEVKLSGVDLKIRISYLYKNNAVQFACELDKAIKKRCGEKCVKGHRKKNLQ